MPEIFHLWMIYPRVDNDQIAILRRFLPAKENLPAASGRVIDFESGGGYFLQR